METETENERRARMRREDIIGRYQKLAKQHDRFDRADKQKQAATQEPPKRRPISWQKQYAK